MTIRAAELKDKKEILELITLLHIDMPGFVWNSDGFIERQIRDGEYFLLEEAGQVAGIMSLRQRSMKMHIETLAVKEEFQRKGYGSALLAFAKQYAKEKQFSALHAYSFEEYNADYFYKKQGFSLLDYIGTYNGHTYHCFSIEL